MKVKGTLGYAQAIQGFVKATEAIKFQDLHDFCLKYFPIESRHILDIGSGSGRDAATIASMGHSVVAVEPCHELLVSAENSYSLPNVQWVQDSLPYLTKLTEKPDQFDFILCSAVWHHIESSERKIAIEAISELLKPGGIFAVTLRNGPAGVGTHVFPTDAQETIDSAKSYNLINLLCQSNQPSLIENKMNVVWSRLVFCKNL